MNEVDFVSVLRANVAYNPETGVLTRIKSMKSCKAGATLGCIRSDGYVSVGFRGKRYMAHRLAWAIVHGYFPKELDHINGAKADNRIENLREVTSSQNNYNLSQRSDNTSGVTGVAWDKSKGLWAAFIGFRGRQIHLGNFSEFDEAVSIRKSAERYYHEGFSRNASEGKKLDPRSLVKVVKSNNTSGHNGVVWDKSRSKWSARINLEGKFLNIGRFDQIEDAVAARKQAEIEYAHRFQSAFTKPTFN